MHNVAIESLLTVPGVTLADLVAHVLAAHGEATDRIELSYCVPVEFANELADRATVRPEAA